MTRKERLLTQAHKERSVSEELAFQRGAEWADNNPNWISVEERLPDSIFYCLVYTEPIDKDGSFEGRYRRGWYDNDNSHVYLRQEDRWHLRNNRLNNSRVTHWMPLPQPPKKGE